MDPAHTPEEIPAPPPRVSDTVKNVAVGVFIVVVALASAWAMGGERTVENGSSAWVLRGGHWTILAARSALTDNLQRKLHVGLDPRRAEVHHGDPAERTGEDEAARHSRDNAGQVAALIANALGGGRVRVAHLGDLEGPSAGMTLTLSAADQAVGHDWTGGMRVAGTGQIDLSGQVIPVGMVPRKLRAARAAGARVAFIPGSTTTAEQMVAEGRAWRDAGTERPAMQVVEVSYVTDALWWLCGARADTRVCADAMVAEQALAGSWGR